MHEKTVTRNTFEHKRDKGNMYVTKLNLII